jgi:CHAT domain-containing protein
MNLNADLVTLSACETALGRIDSGDDVIGLTRGFFYAGASSIISSLWEVDDAATYQMMTDFYRALDKRGKAEALLTAQRAVKAKYPHPYYWAAFQLAGNR